MKKDTIRIIISIISVFSIIACDKEFKLDIKAGDTKIVLNSFFNGDGPIKATVTKSMAPQDLANITELPNASVMLYKDDVFVEQLIYSKNPKDTLGYFTSFSTPEYGSTYKLEVLTNDYGTAAGTSQLPEMVSMDVNTTVWVPWVVPEDSSRVLRVYFELSFPDPQPDNFYYLTAALPVYNVDTINNLRTFHAWQYGEIITGDLPGHQLYINNALLFKDLNFNSETKKITGTITMSAYPSSLVYDYGYDENGNIEVGNYILDKSAIHFELHSLSHDAYNFCSSFARKLSVAKDLYSEPITIYGNVTNGLGIFAGENIDNEATLITY